MFLFSLFVSFHFLLLMFLFYLFFCFSFIVVLISLFLFLFFLCVSILFFFLSICYFSVCSYLSISFYVCFKSVSNLQLLLQVSSCLRETEFHFFSIFLKTFFPQRLDPHPRARHGLTGRGTSTK